MLHKKIFLSLLCATALMISAFGGNNSDNTTPTGKYTLISIEDDLGNNWIEFFKMMEIEIDNLYIDFQSEDKCKMVLPMVEDNNAMEGTFKMDGNNIIFYFDNQELKGAIEDDKVIIVQEADPNAQEGVATSNVKMVFEKK